jgi:S-adenosylmethionine-dependent methyltransferase
MTPNSWMENSGALMVAYARHNSGVLGTLRQRLLTRALSAHMPAGPQRIIDVGGGEGHQAIALARAGHRVVLLDPDAAMLAAAEQRLAQQEQAVRDRVTMVLGYGENAADVVTGQFDVVCCHGILMYIDDPAAILKSIVSVAWPGALISVLASNADAVAMRPALQGRWADALAILETGSDDETARYVPGRADTVENIQAILTEARATVMTWYGVRVFSDHLGDVPPGEDFESLCELEWAAGARDPYRKVARLFHVIARRDADQ